MSDENDSWLKSTLGIDVPSFLGGDATNTAVADAGMPPAAPDAPPVDPSAAPAVPQPPFVEEKMPAIPGVTAIEVVEGEVDLGNPDGSGQPTSGEQGDGAQTTPTPAGKPVITSVESDGEDFKIKGTGFTPNANVTIRGRQLGTDWAQERYYPVHSDKDGKIDCRVPGSYVCYAPGAIRFSGTNGHGNKEDFSRILWSDDVEATCTIGKPDKDEDKDDSDSDDSSKRKEGKIYAGLKTRYGSVTGESVKYWIQDWTNNKMLVDGVKKASGEVIWFNCECSGQPDHGKVYYWHEKFMAKNEVIVADGAVTEMLP